MRWWRASLLGLVLLTGSTGSTHELASELQQTGLWSRRAIPLVFHDGRREQVLNAPKGRTRVRVSDAELHVQNRNEEMRGSPINFAVLAELLWNTDGTAFAVTESDGGDVGTWSVRLFSIVDHRLVETDVNELVRAAFSNVPSCQDQEIGNVAALAWTEGSKSIMLIAEVPPHSSCRNLGEIRGYRVDLSRRQIVSVLSENDLREQFQDSLGVRMARR